MLKMSALAIKGKTILSSNCKAFLCRTMKTIKTKISDKSFHINNSERTTHSKTRENPTGFEILKDGDKRFGSVVIGAKSRKERRKRQIILLEGHRLIADAIRSGANAKCIYFSQIDILNRLPLDLIDAALYKVHYQHMKLWSDVETPPGIMGIFEMPKEGSISIPENALPVTVICDNIRDPGNMGTLIRTAAAVSCQKILTTKGCVDVWDPKVLRAGMGSHFHIPIFSSLSWDQLTNSMSSDMQILVADTDYNIQRRDQQIVDSDLLLSSEDSFYENDETDSDSDDKTNLDKYKKVPLPASVYHQIKYQNQNIVLIIGGETHGISVEAKKLAFDFYGQYITIPLSSFVNSLNCSVASSIILYEIHRQLKFSERDN